MRLALSSSQPHSARGQALAAAPSFAARCGAALRSWLQPRSHPALEVSSHIRRYDVFEQPRAWARCREAGWYHQSRARRALDREDWPAAERHARQALEWDDTRAANYLALGEALAHRTPPDPNGARAALEAAFNLEPANSYIVDRLQALYERLGDRVATARLLRRALAAGAPAQVWAPELARLEAAAAIAFAS